MAIGSTSAQSSLGIGVISTCQHLSLASAVRLAEPFFFANQKKKGNSYQSSIADFPLPAPVTQWSQSPGAAHQNWTFLDACSTLSQPATTSDVQEQAAAPTRLPSYIDPGEGMLQGSCLQPASDHMSTTPIVEAAEHPSAYHQQDRSRRFASPHNHERCYNGVHSKQSRSRFFCPFLCCPRSTPQYGFARKDKLVDHLRSNKHNLSHGEALYKATMHNVRRGLSEKNANQ
jgi:hypothetical protein